MNTNLSTNPLITIPYTNNDTVYNLVAIDDREGRLAVRSKIENYEEALKKLVGSERGDCDEINSNGLNEYFLGKAYIRELFIPKDTTMVSKIWNQERSWIISKGEVTIVTEMGTRRVKAPYTEVVPPGSKVALYTHEDTQWLAMTKIKTTSIDGVEAEVIADDYSKCVYPWDLLTDKTGDIK